MFHQLHQMDNQIYFCDGPSFLGHRFAVTNVSKEIGYEQRIEEGDLGETGRP